MRRKSRILVVDDELAMVRLLNTELDAHGFSVQLAQTDAQAIHLAEQEPPDVAIIDVTRRTTGGLALMRELRQRCGAHVICVSSSPSAAERINALREGAADYVAKPFNPEEVGARVAAILRRVQSQDPDGLVCAGEVEVDLVSRRVRRNGREISLTRTEWLLIQHLASNAGKVIMYNELLAHIWGPEYLGQRQYVRLWISRLRQKLGDPPRGQGIIKTMSGLGYVFSPTGPTRELEYASRGRELRGSLSDDR